MRRKQGDEGLEDEFPPVRTPISEQARLDSNYAHTDVLSRFHLLQSQKWISGARVQYTIIHGSALLGPEFVQETKRGFLANFVLVLLHRSLVRAQHHLRHPPPVQRRPTEGRKNPPRAACAGCSRPILAASVLYSPTVNSRALPSFHSETMFLILTIFISL